MKRFAFLFFLLANTAWASLFSETVAFKGVLNSTIATNAPFVSLPVDTIIDFHSQTVNQKYDTNKIQTDVLGNSTRWRIGNEGTQNDLILTNIVVPSFALAIPVQSADGTYVTNTATTGEREDLAGGAAGTLTQIYEWPGASLVSATFWLMFTNISAPTQNSRDFYLWIGNPYAVAQFNVYDFNTGGTQLKSGLHIQIPDATPSLVENVPTNVWIKAELVEDLTNGMGFVTYRVATNNTLLFSSIGYGEASADLQTVFQEKAGYIYLATISGQVHHGTCILATSNNVPTNRPPWIPNAPSNVSASQTGSGTVLGSITDNNFQLNSNKFSVSNATEGEFVGWITPESTSVSISGLTDGHTYDTRATAYFINGVKSSTVSGTSVTLTSPVWYDSMTISGNTNSTVDQNLSFENYAVPVTVATGGTCTKVRLAFNTINNSGNPFPIKLAVFDGSKNLVGSLTTLTGITTGLIEFSVTPFAVSAGTYYIGFNANCNAGGVLYWSKSGTTGTEVHAANTSFDYANYPPSNLGAADIGTTETIAAGMLVQ